MKTITHPSWVKLFLLPAIFFNFSLYAQPTLNFTIDAATASGQSITETITNSGKTYVLTATHSIGAAGLWNDGGTGDLMFFGYPDGSPNVTWTISVTEDGVPMTFTFNSADFKSFSFMPLDRYDILNNSGEIITNSFGIAQNTSGTTGIDNPENAANITSLIIRGINGSATQAVDWHNINLTIGMPACNSTASFSVATCGFYTVPSGKNTYATSGIYTDTIPNAAGCDSILTIDVTVNPNQVVTINKSACAAYTVPSGDETYTKSGTYMDTIPTVAGCDSILRIKLIMKSATAAATQTNDSTLWALLPDVPYKWLDCDNDYKALAGETNRSFITKKDGNYALEITNNGCKDTTLCYGLDVKKDCYTTSHSFAVTLCDEYTVPSGDETYTESGIYMDTIANVGGCDSILTIDLTVNHSPKTPMEIASCFSYTVPSGDETYIESGIYWDTIPTSAGCDSILIISLTIDTVDTFLDKTTDFSLYSRSKNATYKWLDCDNGLVEIVNQSGRYFVAENSGNYALEVKQHGCVDTSYCYSLVEKPDFCNETKASIVIDACEEYILPSGKSIVKASGTYTDTIPNMDGCDSVLTIYVTINRKKYASIQPISCVQYISPSGKTISKSGTYRDTISAISGCDSIITIDLTIPEISTDVTEHNFALISNDSKANFQWMSCSDGYTALEGKSNKTLIPEKTGIYAVAIDKLGCKDTSVCYTVEVKEKSLQALFTIDNALVQTGDSLVEKIMINGNEYTLSVIHSSGGITLRDKGNGNKLFTSNFGFRERNSWTMFITENGIPVQFTFNQIQYHSFSMQPYQYEIMNQDSQLITNPFSTENNSLGMAPMDSGIYAYKIDSLILTGISKESTEKVGWHNLSVNIFSNITCKHQSKSFAINACGSYTVPSGYKTYTESGVYFDTIPTALGCDSSLTISLTIEKLTTTITQSGNRLTADAFGVDYQWLDCNNNYEPIPGENSRILIAKKGGDYAAAITKDGCSDTTICKNVILIAGVEENPNDTGLKVYPNPVSNTLYINSERNNPLEEIIFLDVNGKKIIQAVSEGDKVEINTKLLEKGVYLLMIKTKKEIITQKLIKQ